MESSSAPRPPALARSEQSSAISKLLVQTTFRYTGRGPDKVRTVISGEVIVVILSDTFTKAEISLVQAGQGALVVEVRRTFQQTMRPDLVAGVEAITGRTVIGFLSDHQVDPDIAAETFILATPVDDEPQAA